MFAKFYVFLISIYFLEDFFDKFFSETLKNVEKLQVFVSLLKKKILEKLLQFPKKGWEFCSILGGFFKCFRIYFENLKNFFIFQKNVFFFLNFKTKNHLKFKKNTCPTFKFKETKEPTKISLGTKKIFEKFPKKIVII